jgi:hypothetical protein
MFSHDNRNQHYNALEDVFEDAYNQAANGKGRERHVTSDVPFHDQAICELEREGYTFCSGQAAKKIREALKTGNEADLLGAMNYLAAFVIVERERSRVVEYEHHGRIVSVMAGNRGKHRRNCICYSCAQFKPGQPDNCAKAQELYELCKRQGVTTPVWECSTYTGKDVPRE